MAKRTESGERPAPDAPKPHEIMALNQQALRAFMDASSTALRGWQAMNVTLMETARHRYQEGIAALQKVAKGQSPAEAYQMQCDFCRSAMEACFEDTTRLLHAAERLATEQWAEFAPGMRPARPDGSIEETK